MTLPQPHDVVHSLCESLVTDASLRVRGPHEGYRCKATYSLTPKLVTSPLSQPTVNALAEAVATFVSEKSVVPQVAPHFFFEVMGKVNRRGETLIKIAFVNVRLTPSIAAVVGDGVRHPNDELAATLFDAWFASAERTALCTFLCQQFPSLVAVVAHVSLHPPPSESSASGKSILRKPDKTSDYVALLPNGATTITEYTPNNIPFQLSADSFCEVNQPMEDAIYDAIKTFLRLDSDDGQNDDSGAAPSSREAFITGRDVNSVVRTFEQFYRAVTSVTSCPCVFEDTKLNHIPSCQLARKDELYKPLADFHMRARQSSDDTLRERHVLLTAGRHGLHPRTSKMLAAMAGSPCGRLTDVIYVSCNVHSMARDLLILKESLVVAHARTFDFFPGTDYVMTVLHLQPVRNQRTLVLPLGMPGVGKSLCGRALRQFFEPLASSSETQAETEPQDGTTHVPKQTQGTKKKRKVEPCAKPFIPRMYSVVDPCVDVVLFERDAIFHQLRDDGGSLKQTRLTVHDELLRALRTGSLPVSCDGADDVTRLLASLQDAEAEVPFRLTAPRRTVIYVDSTNGDVEARQLYATTFQAGTCAGAVEAHAMEVAFNLRSPLPNETLLHRVGKRASHPGFPTEADAQQKKLESIGIMMRSERAEAVANGATRVHIDSAADGEEYFTVSQVLVAVSAHLWFSVALAETIRETAVVLLLRVGQ